MEVAAQTDVFLRKIDNSMDLPAFHDFFRDCKSMAIVGNADTILNYENGHFIDAHDVVVRFNKAYTAGVERNVGSRTDILVANATYSASKAARPRESVNPRCIVCFLEPRQDTNYSAFLDWVRGVPTLMVFIPDLIGVPQTQRTRPVTLGTDALYTFLRLFSLECLFLTGFTFYGAAGGSRRVYWEDRRVSRGLFHDLGIEARIFAHLANSFEGELHVTAEVEDVLNSYGSARRRGRPPISRTESLYARVGWHLIDWGMRLRMRAEARGSARFYADRPPMRY